MRGQLLYEMSPRGESIGLEEMARLAQIIFAADQVHYYICYDFCSTTDV